MFLFRFLGGIISGIISRIIVMGLMFGGGAYFLQTQGGIQGVAALITGEEGAAGSGLPSVAGIGGLTSLLPQLTGASKEPDFFEQQARISKIDIECRLTLRKGSTLSQTQPLDCHRARAALADPQFAGYEMKKTNIATYIYYAMDGVNVHTGKTRLKQRRNIGDVIDIEVNRLDPRDSSPI